MEKQNFLLHFLSVLIMLIMFPLYYIDQQNTFNFNFTLISLVIIPIIFVIINIVIECLNRWPKSTSLINSIILIVIGLYFMVLSYITAIGRLKSFYYVLPLVSVIIPIIYYCVSIKVKFKTKLSFYIVKYFFILINIVISYLIIIVMRMF
jgi:hypothetical protein